MLSSNKSKEIKRQAAFDDIRRNAYLIGVLYTVLRTLELDEKEITYSVVAASMQHHCSKNELHKVLDEVESFAQTAAILSMFE